MAGVITAYLRLAASSCSGHHGELARQRRGHGLAEGYLDDPVAGAAGVRDLLSLAIVFFCFFYTALVFNARETADNLKKSGAFIPGIRPGEQTGEIHR